MVFSVSSLGNHLRGLLSRRLPAVLGETVSQFRTPIFLAALTFKSLGRGPPGGQE